jgi:hypothetical protein
MKKFRKWVLIFGAALVLGPVCHGQVVADAKAQFLLSGIVRDPSGAPAADVPVTFYPGQNSMMPEDAETRTDKNGRYEMILHRKYSGPVSLPGPFSLTNRLMARDLGRNLAALREFIGTATNLDLDLQTGITLSGFVKDTTGAPMSNLPVNLRIWWDNVYCQLRPPPDRTDAQGSFSIPALPQGRLYILGNITAPGYGPVGGALKAEDAHTNRYEFPPFVLKRPDRKLAGQVLAPDGTPVVGADVSFNGIGQTASATEGGPFSYSSRETDALGHFAFDAVCEGPVTVTAYDNNHSDKGMTSAQGGDTNVILRLGIYSGNFYMSNSYGPPLRIAGTVRDPSGAPSGGVDMSLLGVRPRALSGQTDSEGKYEFNWQELSAVSGTYSLMARDLKHGLAAIHPVDTKTTNLDLSLQEGLTLSTQVKDRSGRAVLTALGMVEISLERQSIGLSPDPIMTDPQGRLLFTALPQGQRYEVYVEASGYTDVSLHAKAEDTKTNLLELTPCVLGRTDLEVSGLVLGVLGEPVAGIELSLSAPRSGKRTTTDSNGRFFFDALNEGLVTVLFDPFNSSTIPPAYRGNAQIQGGGTASNGANKPSLQYVYYTGAATNRAGEKNMVIRLHANTNRLASPARGAISGTVRDPSGAPVSGVLVSSERPDFPDVTTDTDGRFKMIETTLPQNVLALAFIGPGEMPDNVIARDPGRNLVAIRKLDWAPTNLDLTLEPGLAFSGSVRDSTGEPVTNAVVGIRYSSRGQFILPYGRQTTPADARGAFLVSALARGMDYYIDIMAEGHGRASDRLKAVEEEGNHFEFPPFVLKPADSKLAGRVLGPDGKPVAGADVSFDGSAQPNLAPWTAPQTSQTDALGRFVFNAVCEGQATLVVNYQGAKASIEASGGDTNIVVKLRMAGGVPPGVPRGNGQAPANPPAATGPLL